MKPFTIDPAACEWYGLAITTEPTTGPTDWEASFDNGANYIAAQAVDLPIDGTPVPHSAWLIAGPDYNGSSNPVFTTAVKTTFVKVRLIDNPETVIRSAPLITTEPQ